MVNFYILADPSLLTGSRAAFFEIGAERERIYDISTQYTTGHCLPGEPWAGACDFTGALVRGRGFAGNKPCSLPAAEAHGQHRAERTQGSICVSAPIAPHLS